MLDVGRLVLDNAGDEDLAFGQLQGFEQRPLVRVAWIGYLWTEAYHSRTVARAVRSAPELLGYSEITSGEFFMRRLTPILGIWALSLVACAAVVAVAFERVDVPMALHFWTDSRFLSPLNQAFGAAIILTA